MSLTLDDVQRIALLARIELAPAEAEATLGQLNGIFGLIEKMQAVDTNGVEPLTTVREIEADGGSGGTAAAGALRLREDAVTETDRRTDYQKPAPAVQDGLYLVPRVIE